MRRNCAVSPAFVFAAPLVRLVCVRARASPLASRHPTARPSPAPRRPHLPEAPVGGRHQGGRLLDVQGLPLQGACAAAGGASPRQRRRAAATHAARRWPRATPSLAASGARRSATTARPRRASTAPPRPCTAASTSSRASATTTAVRRLRRLRASAPSARPRGAALRALLCDAPAALYYFPPLCACAGPTSSMTWEPIGAPPRPRSPPFSSRRAQLTRPSYPTAVSLARRRPPPRICALQWSARSTRSWT